MPQWTAGNDHGRLLRPSGSQTLRTWDYILPGNAFIIKGQKCGKFHIRFIRTLRTLKISTEKWKRGWTICKRRKWDCLKKRRDLGQWIRWQRAGFSESGGLSGYATSVIGKISADRHPLHCVIRVDAILLQFFVLRVILPMMLLPLPLKIITQAWLILSAKIWLLSNSLSDPVLTCKVFLQPTPTSPFSVLKAPAKVLFSTTSLVQIFQSSTLW